MIGSWGVIQYPLDGTGSYIHEDDIEKWNMLSAPGKVIKCIGVTGEYLIVEYREASYRIKPEIFNVIPSPVFTFGDLVQDVNHPERVGTIDETMWHYKDKCHYFFIVTLRGKHISKRYHAGGLVKL